MNGTARHRVVVLGGGFGGLSAVRALRRADVDVALVDHRNFHLFQPLLYQVATGGLSPADIAAPLRAVLKRQRNVRVVKARAVDVDPDARVVELDDGELRYDTLVVATGARNFYFGNAEFERRAPGLKTLEDATRMRAAVLSAFERAEREPGRASVDQTFVIVGGGPTGVELAGAIAELARQTLRRDFRAIDPAASRIELIEAGDDLLPSFDATLRARARRSLERLGVNVRVNTRLERVADDRVELVDREGNATTLAAGTVLWAAGVRASEFGDVLATRFEADVDRGGRLEVDGSGNLLGHPEVFVIGDLAAFRQDGESLPGIAPVAMQAGRFVGRRIRDRLRGIDATRPFRYRDKGMLAVIGRAAAVAEVGRLRFSGYAAWLLWLFAHLLYLVGFENRLLVMIQWGWNYATRNRSARLITDPPDSETADGGELPDRDARPSRTGGRAVP